MPIAAHLFVWTLHDIIGGVLLGIILLGFGGWLAYLAFIDWKRSPKRWWNKRK